MKKRKQRLSIFDIGRLPLVPVAVPTGDAAPVGTLKQYREREQAREAQETAKTEAEIQRVQKDTSRLMAECLATSAPQMTAFWSQPLDRIKPRISDPRVFDELFLPKSEETPDTNVVFDTIANFLNDTVFEQGFSLSQISMARFGLYAASEVRAGVIVNPESLMVMFRRCFDLGIFKDDPDTEFNDNFRAVKPVKQPRVEPEQPRQATMDDLMNIDEGTRAGQREAHRVSEELYFIERQPMVKAWFDSLANNFGIIVTHADAERCKQWFLRCNKSFLNPAHFDECRRWNAKAGYWENALTSVERVNDEIEQADLTRMGFDERRILNNRKRAAQEEDRARFGHSQ